MMKIVICGGGSAGWMTAAALSNALPADAFTVLLVESESIGTVGVGEATLPHLRHFNETLGINEKEFMRETKATIKLGIQFENWGRIGDSYIHPFGQQGQSIGNLPFHQIWQYLHRNKTEGLKSFHDYSMGVRMAKANKFSVPNPHSGSYSDSYSYAYHVDSSLYAKYLRQYSEKKGVLRVEGKICDVKVNTEDGIEHVALETGEQIGADLFIDCTGFRSLLLGGALNVDFENWEKYLPCNSAVTVQSESDSSNGLRPYSRAIAHEAGWQWQIPLRHRTGNGHVFSTRYTSDEEAKQRLVENLPGKMLGEPRYIRFTTGRRKKIWHQNCVAIGLSAGFLEPLESTSLYLIQLGITKLLDYLPGESKCLNQKLEKYYNRDILGEFENTRDFLVVHYSSTQRDDSDFWRYCKNITLPNSLMKKYHLYQKFGLINDNRNGLFCDESWSAVLLGQNMFSNKVDSRADNLKPEKVKTFLSDIDRVISRRVATSSHHGDFLARRV